MLGLMVLLAIGVYLALSALVVWLAVRIARKLNRRAWLWGGMAAFVMYNLVFWDWIPTVVMHKYYCATEAGFWVYKTPEQWDRENPGVLGTLKPYPNPISLAPPTYNYKASKVVGLEMADKYNDRFLLRYKMKGDLNGLFVHRSETTIFDLGASNVITRRVDYGTGHGSQAVWKFWLSSDSCNRGVAVNAGSREAAIRRQLNMTRMEN